MRNCLIYIAIMMVSALAFATVPPAIGSITVQGVDQTIELRIIDTTNAIAAGNGVVLMSLPDGRIGAADLVDTLDADASGIFINTAYGIRAWRQGFPSHFARVLRGFGDDYGTSVVQTNDGGLVVAGVTDSYGAGGKDILVVKFNHRGAFLWAKAIGSPANDAFTGGSQFGTVAEATFDGGVILGTCTFGFGTIMRDIMVVKLDEAGNIQWSLKYGGADREELRGIRQLPDSSYIAVGWSWSYPVDIQKIIITRISRHGSHLWSRVIGSGRRNLGQYFDIGPDGSLYIAGWTQEAYGNIGVSAIVMKTNPMGEVIWARTIGGSETDEDIDDKLYGITALSGGGCLVSGYSNNAVSSGEAGLLVRFDESGNAISSKSVYYGLSEADSLRCYTLEVQSDGSILVLSHIDEDSGTSLMKFNADLSLEWSRNFDIMQITRVGNFAITDDDGYAITGFTNAFAGTGIDLMLVKLDEDGESCIGEFDTPFVIDEVLDIRSVEPESELITPEAATISPTVTNIEPSIMELCP